MPLELADYKSMLVQAGNGLVPSGNKLVPELKLTQIFVAKWRHQASMSWEKPEVKQLIGNYIS